MGTKRHSYNFDGGDELSTMSAGWFVSYLWYNNIDSTHLNWNRVSTYSSRISVYKRTSKYYKYWLLKIVQMNENNLKKGTIGLKGSEIKAMAQKMLDIL